MRARAVLHAESNALLRGLATTILHRMGHVAAVVGNGREVLDTIRSEAAPQRPLFDILLLNVAMPDMDGYATCKAVRDLGGQFAALPIIALADLECFDHGRFEAAGFNALMRRPVDWLELEHSIARLTHQARAKDEGFVQESALEEHLFDASMLAGLKSTRAPEQMRKILHVALSSIDKPLLQMRLAQERDDLKAFHQALHMLKGMAGQLGGNLIAALAEQFEPLTAEQIREAAPLLAEMQGLVDGLRRQLLAMRDSLRPG